MAENKNFDTLVKASSASSFSSFLSASSIRPRRRRIRRIRRKDDFNDDDDDDSDDTFPSDQENPPPSDHENPPPSDDENPPPSDDEDPPPSDHEEEDGHPRRPIRAVLRLVGKTTPVVLEEAVLNAIDGERIRLGGDLGIELEAYLRFVDANRPPRENNGGRKCRKCRGELELGIWHADDYSLCVGCKDAFLARNELEAQVPADEQIPAEGPADGEDQDVGQDQEPFLEPFMEPDLDPVHEPVEELVQEPVEEYEQAAAGFRTETDTMGEMQVPNDKLYGCQTARSLKNFPIGGEGDKIPRQIIQAFGYLKKACAEANQKFGLDAQLADAIKLAAEEVIYGTLYDEGHFPLCTFQAGSGTQANINTNEVISNRANLILDSEVGTNFPVHPNDHVNKSQTSNSTFPTAMHVATALEIKNDLLPALLNFRHAFYEKQKPFEHIVEIGGNHMMDRTPLTLGKELSGYVQQLDNGIARVEATLPRVYELAIGGTAVGTGLNAGIGFAEACCQELFNYTGLPFVSKFDALPNHEAMVEVSRALNVVAHAIHKIANGIRLLASGPHCGLPEKEKVNPTQVEAITMVCTQVMANNMFVNAGDNFELNVSTPVIASNVLRSAKLIGTACNAFVDNSIDPLLNESLMLVTALHLHFGQDKAVHIAKNADKEGITLREAAKEDGITDEQLDALVGQTE